METYLFVGYVKKAQPVLSYKMTKQKMKLRFNGVFHSDPQCLCFISEQKKGKIAFGGGQNGFIKFLDPKTSEISTSKLKNVLEWPLNYIELDQTEIVPTLSQCVLVYDSNSNQRKRVFRDHLPVIRLSTTVNSQFWNHSRQMQTDGCSLYYVNKDKRLIARKLEDILDESKGPEQFSSVAEDVDIFNIDRKGSLYIANSKKTLFRILPNHRLFPKKFCYEINTEHEIHYSTDIQIQDDYVVLTTYSENKGDRVTSIYSLNKRLELRARNEFQIERLHEFGLFTRILKFTSIRILVVCRHIHYLDILYLSKSRIIMLKKNVGKDEEGNKFPSWIYGIAWSHDSKQLFIPTGNDIYSISLSF